VPLLYQRRLGEFDKTTAATVIGHLVANVAAAGHHELKLAQVPAWQTAIEVMDVVARTLIARHGGAAAWELILEYEIPRRQKRPDVILLADDLIFVIEFKAGATGYAIADQWQALSYALDLYDFHLESHERTIIPILLSTEAPSRVNPQVEGKGVCQVQFHNPTTLAEGIEAVYAHCHQAERPPIEAARWVASGYRPSRTIIEAAERLYQQHDVREISHASARNLSGTTDCLLRAIQTAQRAHKRLCCFVTGVPGAGKTLAGLNAVHDPEVRREGRPPGVFLSGNGPLIKIVSEALARSQSGAAGDKNERIRRIRAFIQNVHAFLKEYATETTRVPPEHVVIFDEAQRAWNAAQMNKKKKVARSEADLLLEIVGRCPDWSVVIALVGGGQEIHDGEAGLSEWGDALRRTSKSWEIWASPEALDGGPSVAGSRLFGGARPAEISLREEPDLHLHVSVRSHRAQRIAEWVNHVVVGDAEAASQVALQFGKFPIALTRELAKAREWLHCHRIDENRRAGLVASSGALRHRAFGIEVSSGFRQGFPYEDWFLGKPPDVRSSSFMEVAATEFEIQGLEIDWSGVCWGNDFWFDTAGGKWRFQRFKGRRWFQVKKEEQRRFVVNKYRVLLTRAREGLIVWVPRGSKTDETLLQSQFDGTAEFLQRCGLREPQ
jgi:hypothetical protein